MSDETEGKARKARRAEGAASNGAPRRQQRRKASEGGAAAARNGAPQAAAPALDIEEVTLVPVEEDTKDTLPVELEAGAVQLTDAASAATPPMVRLGDDDGVPETNPEELPVPVQNLGADTQAAAHGRIDSLLAALETEIRAMPSADTERQSAIAEVIGLIRSSMTRWPKQVLDQAMTALRSNINSDYLDADFWKGIALVLRYQLDANVDTLKRRFRGDYAVDEFGLDPEFLELARPLVTFMYTKYWRVESSGLEHVPEEGRALLVCNHSGVLPWDGAMVGAALMFEHPTARLLRCLHLSWFSSIPFIAPLLSRMGQVQALPANAERLLERDELVGVFPEGLKGVGKLFKDRYKLARFGRGGFVKVAVKTGAPIIPVSIVGSEEIHPNLYDVKPLAKLLGFPYFPLTPTWPWLGPLGLIPLPSKWYIIFGEPIPTAEYGAHRADDPLLISQLTEQVRSTIQQTILEKLKTRPGVFLGE